MDTEDDIRSALAHAAGGPPMRMQADDVIVRGGRIRLLRKRWAVAGSSVATALVLAVAGFTAGHRGGEPTPVQPARPELSTVATTPPPSSSEPTPAPATVLPGPPEPSTSRTAPAVPASTRPGRTTSPPSATQKPPSATTVHTEPPTATTTP